MSEDEIEIEVDEYEEINPKYKNIFWAKNLLYDITGLPEEKKINLEQISFKDYFSCRPHNAFLYENNLKTYFFTICQKLKEFYNIDNITPGTMNKKNYKEKYALCFCSKYIEEFDIKCKPDEMICKQCMEDNKEIYHLNKHKSILININGRVSTNAFKDKKFHCLGKFKINKEIKNCIPKDFTCIACQKLNEAKEYYE